VELFEKRKVALISVTESLDTGSSAGRLVTTIMGAVSQWEREAIGERTRDRFGTSGAKGSEWATSRSGRDSRRTGNIWNQNRVSRQRWRKSGGSAAKARRFGGSLWL
jgi:DNA invertase Pin-like site-specific DNA recombinase